ncbi:hypothetical protein KM914_14295 [Virgibacillus pantothenticus]|uniref:phage tail protein n=1 Tax=Virgibacillus pantothenticus TaxID=1473 RepID=UPI001C241AE4|nr:hypothetical protein [Virgibacillus pantothenticus]MBU8567590.1 hypothetical protein [Virgibacillus pantothenticus]MBU8601378.1 hypothetical protein [Virgibacillus pantothenticus]MBU8636195.1 hypothetical protein [Virgibacillus pantothenticus]MBU8643715.1 hypothetical protein [Virgibacillus pantothenticus]MBU8648029.1 hypothetical protein [Virgibacillus pantothenticus]
MSNYSIEAEIKANISKYRKAIQSAKRVTQSFKREADRAKNTELDGDTKPLNRSLKKAKMLMHKFTKSKNEVNIDADTSEAVRKMGMLQAIKTALNKRVVIPIEARVNKFHRMVGRIANNIRALETVSLSVFTGIGIIASTVAIPALAALVPVIAAIGNSLAVVGSAAVALGAGFGIAGGAVLAFGAAALPTITSIADGTAKATEENKKAAKALETLKSSWQKVQEAIAPQVAVAFGNALNGIEASITSLQPMFENVASTVASLSTKFNEFTGSKTAQAFFGYLNKNAGPILDKIVSGIGGFIKGLMNLTVAFAPLTDFVVQGFANMGQSFANFTGKIQGSAALQNFINFVKTNLPLIGAIFGDIFMGIINLFSSFSGSTTSILQSLATMAESFRAWSATVKESDGFQQFMLYVQENGPKVMSLIGQLITFVMNMAIALAPLGAVVLDLATKFFTWMNGLMQTNPWIGTLIAMGGLLVSALLKLAPVIGLVINTFSALVGIVSKIAPWIMGTVTAVAAFIGVLIYLYNTNETVRAAIQTAWSFIMNIIQTVITEVYSFVLSIWGQLVTWWQQNNQMILQAAQNVWSVISTVISTVMNIIWGIMQAIWPIIKSLVISTWNAIKGAIQAAINIILGIIEFFSALFTGNWSKLWQATKKIVSNAVKLVWNLVQLWFVGKILKLGKTLFKSLTGIVKNLWSKVSSFFTSGVTKAKNIVSTGFNFIKSKISSVMNAIKSIISSIWNSIKGVIARVVNSIKSKVSNVFNSLKGVTSKAFNAVKNAVKSGMDKALNVVTNIKDKFLDAGKNIVGSIAKGITGAIGKVKDAIGKVTSKIRDFLPFSPAKEGALRDIMKIQIPQSIAKSIDRGRSVAVKSMANLTSSINKEMPNPEIQFKTSKITSSLRSLNRKSTAQVKSAINADVSVSKQPANINIRIGRTEFRTFVEDITDQQLRGAFSDSKIKF